MACMRGVYARRKSWCIGVVGVETQELRLRTLVNGQSSVISDLSEQISPLSLFPSPFTLAWPLAIVRIPHDSWMIVVGLR